MDLAKLSIGLYEILVLMLPGLLVICETWIALRDWHRFVEITWNLTTVPGVLLVLASVCIGELVQESAELLSQRIGGARCLKRGRDAFWSDQDSAPVKTLIFAHLKHNIQNVDTAFDYCLTRIDKRFPKRDVFMATSDFSGSLAVALLYASFPIIKFALRQPGLWQKILSGGCGLLIVIGMAILAWRRMIRFRELADVPVFRIFLATCHESALPQPSPSLLSTDSNSSSPK